jgi:hypothetical protein
VRRIPHRSGMAGTMLVHDRLSHWWSRAIWWHGVLALLCGACVASCSLSTVGLPPAYPPIEKDTFALWSRFVQVDSVQPTLQWQSFPPPIDGTGTAQGMLPAVEQVTYELRVWKTQPGHPEALVYARQGFPEPSHALENPLDPSSQYLWTVRAHFLLDGRPRTTEWGLAGYALRDEVVPNRSCFRFATL